MNKKITKDSYLDFNGYHLLKKKYQVVDVNIDLVYNFV